MIVIGLAAAYFITSVLAIILKIIGSLLGVAGVMVCVSETLWLFQVEKMKKKVVLAIRLLDIISLVVGVLLVAGYWLSR